MKRVILYALSMLFAATITNAQELTVKEVDVSTVIQEGTFKVYSFGYGSNPEQELAEARARTQAMVQLSEVINGFSFTFQESSNAYMFIAQSSGSLANRETENIIPFDGPDYAFIYVMSSEMDQSVLQADELLAYEVRTILSNASALRSAVPRTRARGIQQFADIKGTNWAEGKGYLSNVDFNIKDDGSIELSYVMLLAVE